MGKTKVGIIEQMATYKGFMNSEVIRGQRHMVFYWFEGFLMSNK